MSPCLQCFIIQSYKYYLHKTYTKQPTSLLNVPYILTELPVFTSAQFSVCCQGNQHSYSPKLTKSINEQRQLQKKSTKLLYLCLWTCFITVKSKLHIKHLYSKACFCCHHLADWHVSVCSCSSCYCSFLNFSEKDRHSIHTHS